MYNRLSLISLKPDLEPGARDSFLEKLRRPVSAGDVLLRPTLPGVYNGGDYLWKVRTPILHAPEASQRLPENRQSLDQVQSVTYKEGEGGGDWSGGGVYRALLLSVRPSTAAGVVERFQRDVLEMPRYIKSIRAWRLSRVLSGEGARNWTHVWEQRYDDLQGLIGPYMMHPYHWSWVDRWFDPESPEWIVDTHLCHSFCSIE